MELAAQSLAPSGRVAAAHPEGLRLATRLSLIKRKKLTDRWIAFTKV